MSSGSNYLPSQLRPGDELKVRLKVKGAGIDRKTGKSVDDIIWDERDRWLPALQEKARFTFYEQFPSGLTIRFLPASRGCVEIGIVMTAVKLIGDIGAIVGFISLISGWIGSASGNVTSASTGGQGVTPSVQIVHNYYYTPATVPGTTPSTSTTSGGSSSTGSTGWVWLAALIIVGILVMLFATQREHSSPSSILVALETYQFESDSLSQFQGDNATSSLAAVDRGFNGGKALELNIKLVPQSGEWAHAGFSVRISPRQEVEAISARVLIEGTASPPSAPIYALLAVRRPDGSVANSAHFELKPGLWTPMFWGLKSAPYTDMQIDGYTLWLLSRGNYRGTVYIDDLNTYQLATPVIAPTVTPVPTRRP